jgi:Tfp pilus assembly protein PilX
MTNLRSFPSSGPRAAERGSAYLLALLVLVVLTVIGLSLAVITQTEVQIGGAEKSATRVLYGADAGVRVQLAAKKTLNDAPKARYVIDTVNFGGATLTEAIDVSPFMVMYKGPCALCTQNVGSEDQYLSVNYVTNGQGRRIGTTATDTLPQANKLVSLMFFTQPTPKPTADEALRTFDPSLTADDVATPGLDIIRY